MTKPVARTDDIDVYLELGVKRTFAGAIEWPGWSRSGKTEADALAALAAYAPRYAAAVAGSGLAIDELDALDTLAVPAGSDVPDRSAAIDRFIVRERVPGNATTEFGAPAIPPEVDLRPLDAAGIDRLGRILEAIWASFDRATVAAAGVTLRLGPRGGGRDLDKIVEHVIGAEEMYLNALGARSPKAEVDLAVRWAALRPVELAAFDARARGDTPANASQSKKLWPPAYFVRRTAWHGLDHLWEIEDRSAPTE